MTTAMELKGEHATAKVFASVIDSGCMSQIYEYLSHPASIGQRVAVMPDCHQGAGCVIGLTATLGQYVVPNVIGVDIGCGVLAVKTDRRIEPGPHEYREEFFTALDGFVRSHIPSGFDVHNRPSDILDRIDVSPEFLGSLESACLTVDSSFDRAQRSFGSLGGGNHFLELAVQDDTGELWVLVHSGSRKFGNDVARYYQGLAESGSKGQRRGLGYLSVESSAGDAYLRHCKLAADFAKINRAAMAATIIAGMKSDARLVVESVHNYIGSDRIIRKGAISAYPGETVVIPWNMRDGSVIGYGKGNVEWNYSAPHGAGRVMSRSQAKLQLNVEDYQQTMREAGVWTTCANEGTLDEAPFAYKPVETVEAVLADTVEIKHRLTPVWNFKGGN